MRKNTIKQKLFELAVKKVTLDPNFIAHHLPEPLDCPRMNYLRLCLCLVPKDLKGLQEVCDYAGVSPKKLPKIFLQKFFPDAFLKE